jgi:hypothetical protein
MWGVLLWSRNSEGKLSVVSWEDNERMEQWVATILEAFGFPTRAKQNDRLLKEIVEAAGFVGQRGSKVAAFPPLSVVL